MATYQFTEHPETGLPGHDGLKLAGLFVLYAVVMLALMCLAVFLAKSP